MSESARFVPVGLARIPLLIRWHARKDGHRLVTGILVPYDKTKAAKRRILCSCGKGWVR